MQEIARNCRTMQTEVDRIRTGVATREELSKAHFRLVTLDEALEQYRTKMVADGSTIAHVNRTQKKFVHICNDTGIDSLTDIRREPIERWIASEIQAKRYLRPV